MEIKIAEPRGFSEEEINAFYELIKKGEQVPTKQLKAKLKSAKLLAAVLDKGKIVSVSVVKYPAATYKNRIYTLAGVKDLAENYVYEIGYAFTEPLYRGNGLHPGLLKEILDRLPNDNFYATTKAKNVPKILEGIGFKRLGNSYTNEKGEQLSLFALTR